MSLGPGLRVHDAAVELVHSGPLGGVALLVAVVALAHPEEVRRERDAWLMPVTGSVHVPCSVQRLSLLDHSADAMAWW